MSIVDTAVWSLMLRRRQSPPAPEVQELEELIRRGRARIIGPVRQEVLSGIRSAAQFEKLRQHLRGFPDIELQTSDFELAADFSNRCRSRGVQGSGTDFLICAAAARRNLSVFTTDRDFEAYAKIFPVKLHKPRS